MYAESHDKGYHEGCPGFGSESSKSLTLLYEFLPDFLKDHDRLINVVLTVKLKHTIFQ